MSEIAATSPPLIAVDIGNSSARFGLFAAERGDEPPQPTSVLESTSADIVSQRLRGHLPPGKCSWRVASVCREAQQRLSAWVWQNRPEDDYRVLSHADLPLAIKVDFPERVGLDRLAAAVAVNHLRSPGRPAIVVDAGTALTVDLVSASGAFLGGAILTGFTMAARALADDTDLLPMVRFSPGDTPPDVVGKSTEEAIRSGLFWGAVGAVRELVERMTRQLQDDPELFVTGGDARKLTVHLSPTATFAADLVLVGIALSSTLAD